jgi:hypothetical protein
LCQRRRDGNVQAIDARSRASVVQSPERSFIVTKVIAALLVGVFAVASATTVFADTKKEEAKKETKK